MSVDSRRYRRVRMPQPLAHSRQGTARGEELAAVGVPQRVQAGILQPCFVGE